MAIKHFFKNWLLALRGCTYNLPSKLSSRFFRSGSGGASALTAPPGYASVSLAAMFCARCEGAIVVIIIIIISSSSSSNIEYLQVGAR